MRLGIVILAAAMTGSSGLAQDRSMIRIDPNAGQKQVALVIGNSEYKVKPLTNPRNDAEAIGARLKQINFQVDVLLDGTKRQMEIAIDDFVKKLGPRDVALFYFAGHGIQVDSENYMIPVDYVGESAVPRYDAQSVGKLQERMQRSGAQLNILILDACRDNPYRGGSRGGPDGWTAMNAATGTYLAFATAPGSTASDNTAGKNGLFTKNFLETLEQPGLSLDQVFGEVRRKVYEGSDTKQVPWMSTSVIGTYYFLPPRETGSNPAPGGPKFDPKSPQITELKPEKLTVEPGETITLLASASDPGSLPLQYFWAANRGAIESSAGSSAKLTAPSIPAGENSSALTVSVTARNELGLTSSREVTIRVTPPAVAPNIEGRVMMYGPNADVWFAGKKPSGAAAPGVIDAILDKTEGVWQVIRVQGAFPGIPITVTAECRANCTVASILEMPSLQNAYQQVRVRVVPAGNKQSMMVRLQYQPTGKRK